MTTGIKPLLDSEAIAKRLGKTVYCIRDMARKGLIPAVKVGRTWRFDLDDVNAAIKATSSGYGELTTNAQDADPW